MISLNFHHWISLISFALGKIQGIFTAALILMGHSLSLASLVLYICLIVSSCVFALIGKTKVDENEQTKEDNSKQLSRSYVQA